MARLRRTVLTEKEYAELCLKCPKPKCTMDYRGQCERTKMYEQPRPGRYITKLINQQNN